MAEAKEKTTTPPAKESALTAPSEGGEQDWIFTVSGTSGEITKIEKVDLAKGQRQEISPAEYAAAVGYDPNAYGAAAYYGYGYDPYSAFAYSYGPYLYQQAYYQGAADYATALEHYAAYGYSPVQQAYYQGIADYASAFA
jgi:hypothetical protein